MQQPGRCCGATRRADRSTPARSSWTGLSTGGRAIATCRDRGSSAATRPASSTPSPLAGSSTDTSPALKRGADLSADDHVDSIVALDIRTGRIKWSRRLTDGDDYNLACLTLGASRDGNGRFQLDEPLGDELRPIIRA